MIYAGAMTLSHRNLCFKTGIAGCALSMILVIVSAFHLLPAFSAVLEESAVRSPGIFQSLAGNLLEPSPYVPLAAIFGSAIYALAGIIMIYIFFEKTQSPEILFVSFFIISLAFESVRLMLPFMKQMYLSNSYLITSYRILIFGRYFGLFSLLTSSICTSGYKIQKEQSAVFIIAMASLIIAMGVPVDALDWDSAMNLLSGHGAVMLMIEWSVLGITIASFFISAYTRGSKSYFYIGLGALLIYLGRNLLLNSDTWITPVPALVMLSLGTWFICSKFHSIYLWL